MQINIPISGKHIPALDGVRGWAIVPVMLYHFTINFKHSPIENAFDRFIVKICGAGWAGVDLFFVLSGFLITGILLDTRGNDNYFSAFYVRRTVRIFPLYFGILLIAFILLSRTMDLTEGRVDVLLANKWWFLSYLINWRIAFIGSFNEIPGGYLWSLAVEEQFYLIWPALVLLFGRSLFRICVVGLILSAGLRPILYAAGVSTTGLYVMTLTHLDGLLVGAMLAIHLRTNVISSSFLRRFKIAAFASIIGVITVFLGEGNCYFYSIGTSLVVYLLLAICFGWVLMISLKRKEGKSQNLLFNAKIIRSFGKYSYAIYLFHHPVGIGVVKFLFDPIKYEIFGTVLPAMLIYVVICTTLSWLVAFASWHLYEMHFLRLKRFIPYKLNNTIR